MTDQEAKLLAKSQTQPQDLEVLNEQEKRDMDDFDSINQLEETMEKESITKKIDNIVRIVGDIWGNVGGGVHDNEINNHGYHKMKNNLKLIIWVTIIYFIVAAACATIVYLLVNILISTLVFEDLVIRIVITSIVNTLLIMGPVIGMVGGLVGWAGWLCLKKRRDQKRKDII